ncbi:MAG: carboxypeptidase regulatory-like domain-containing protein [Saprospiraceae bacterium]|nr:carboxypeptidase regulatory-like domain-containing protein [Saprospiraceae bacterium]
MVHFSAKPKNKPPLFLSLCEQKARKLNFTLIPKNHIILKINKTMNLSRLRVRGILFAFFLSLTAVCLAQNELTQTLRGQIRDAVTNAPIPSASVQLVEKKLKIAADTEGVFRFEKLLVGRYALLVYCVGYQAITLDNIVLESGRETILDLKMTASTTLLDNFEVRSTTPTIAKIGLAQSVNMETLQRVPANFSDVARMLTNEAGVASENDAANHISVRGLSPNALQWFLEGAEIVNPNHLSNAGTANDRSTQNGGGVSIFSTQVLERADFYKGSTPTDFGNALGGAIDVHFRKGNNERQETTLGIGLIGLDAATEGVFSQKTNASYLINYRYSTVGLLSKLGVPLGDEASAFQDVSFKLNFPTQKLGEFAIFGMGGISENIFLHKKRDKWETQKDSQDITFKNRMGAIGANHNVRLSAKANWQTVAVVSGLQNSRVAEGFNVQDLRVRIFDYRSNQRKVFAKTQLKYKFDGGSVSGGMVVKNEFIDAQDSYQTQTYTGVENISNGQGMTYMPFVDFSEKFGKHWAYSVGLRAPYFSFTKKMSIEPRAILIYKLNNTQVIELSYSRQSQLLGTDLYFRKNNNNQYYNADKDFIKSDNVNLTYRNEFANGICFSATAFGQFYRNIFVLDLPFAPIGYWSILDGMTILNNFSSVMAGTAQSIGFEASVSQNYQNGWFWQLNGTLFDASFNRGTRSLGNNSRFIVNGYVGKEWILKGRKNRFLGVGSRTILRGGNVQYAPDLSFRTLKVSNYFRSDANIYVKRNRKTWSSTLQLDIQNISNRKNEQYYYFDVFKQKTDTQYQLGLLPNLSYRISF